MSGAGPRSGWFPDPSGRHEERWWDDPQWTDDVRDGGERSVDPLVTVPAPSTVPTAGSSSAAAASVPTPGHPVLDAPTLVVAMPAVGGGTWQDTLPVLDADDKPLGWVQLGKVKHGWAGDEASATLVDASGAPLLGARRTTTVGQTRSGPSHGFELLDAQGALVSRGQHSRVIDRQRLRFSLGGTEIVRLDFTHSRRHQASPTTISAGAVEIGRIVQLGQRAPAGPAGSWLRLDRAPGLGEPQRTFATAAPLVILAYIT